MVQEAGAEPGGAGGAGAPELARRGEQHGSLSSRSAPSTAGVRWLAEPSSSRRRLRGAGQGGAGAGGPGGSDFLSGKGKIVGLVGILRMSIIVLPLPREPWGSCGSGVPTIQKGLNHLGFGISLFSSPSIVAGNSRFGVSSLPSVG